MKPSSKINIGSPISNLPSERLNRLSLQIDWKNTGEIPVFPGELDLLDGSLDNVLAHVRKCRKIDSDKK